MRPTFRRVYKFPGCSTGLENPFAHIWWEGTVVFTNRLLPPLNIQTLREAVRFLEQDLGQPYDAYYYLPQTEAGQDYLAVPTSRLEDVTLAMKDSEDTKKQLEEIMAKGRRHLRSTKKYNT